MRIAGAVMAIIFALALIAQVIFYLHSWSNDRRGGGQ